MCDTVNSFILIIVCLPLIEHRMTRKDQQRHRLVDDIVCSCSCGWDIGLAYTFGTNGPLPEDDDDNDMQQ